MNLLTLDQATVNALEFFIKNQPPSFNLNQFELPLVVGSGNALSTGRIIFSGKPAIFADESNFKQVMAAYDPLIKQGLISQTVIVSASGEKDSVWETQLANRNNLKTTLLTLKEKSTAAEEADQVLTFQSLDEPYTYNTSTYMGMILGSTGEDAASILEVIRQIRLPDNFANYQAYSFILPDKYAEITPMIVVKRDELFGPRVMIRANTFGHARHAKYVHPWEDELVMTIGADNKHFGLADHRWDIDFPQNLSYAGMMALTYYLVGQIQQVKPAYFMENIEAFCSDYGPKAYGKKQNFEVIVPGTN